MRIAIFGTGGAGGFFGAQLARAGEDVAFIARGEHLRAIRERGLRIEAPGGETVIHPARASDNAAEIGPVDAVLLGVKTWQVDEAARSMRPMVGPQTFVVPLQNGVEAPTQLAQALGAGHVLGGLCRTFSWVAAPGVIRTLGSTNAIVFGELDNRPSERTRGLRESFARAGVAAEIADDIHAALWSKFLLITAFGGVGAVTRAPVGIIRTLPQTRHLLETCMHEVLALARARGVRLADSAVAQTLRFIESLAPAATTSLQRDIADGKPSELEAWNGAVVRLAAGAGIDVPLNRTIYASLLPLEKRARGELVFPG